jgi:hypothetical protein
MNRKGNLEREKEIENATKEIKDIKNQWRGGISKMAARGRKQKVCLLK